MGIIDDPVVNCHWCINLCEPHESHALAKEFYDCLIAEDTARQEAWILRESLAVARNDVLLTNFAGHFPIGTHWYSDLETMWAEGENNPMFKAICEAINYPIRKHPEPPWRQVAERALAKRHGEQAEIKRILRQIRQEQSRSAQPQTVAQRFKGEG